MILVGVSFAFVWRTTVQIARFAPVIKTLSGVVGERFSMIVIFIVASCLFFV